VSGTRLLIWDFDGTLAGIEDFLSKAVAA